MNMMSGVVVEGQCIPISDCQRFATPEIVTSYVDCGKEKAACRIKSALSVETVGELFVRAYEECFYKLTRDNPENETPLMRSQLLRTSIRAASILCAYARYMRENASEVEICEILDRNAQSFYVLNPPIKGGDAATRWIDGARDFFQNYAQDTLHPKLILWLDAKLTAAERRNRDELITAMRTMFRAGPCPSA